MIKQKSLKTNFIMNMVLTISSFLFPIITFPYSSRILLPEGMGKVNFAISVITYFSMIAQLGIPTYGIRATAKVRDNKYELTKVVHEIILINIITCIIMYVLFFISLMAVPQFKNEKLLFIIFSINIIFNIFGVEWLYKGLEEYSYIAIRSIIFKIVSIILMFILVHKKSDYIIYGGIMVFANIGSNILNFINLHNYISFKPIGRYNLIRHIKPILVFFSMSVATAIYTNLDISLLGFLATNVDVGYYSAGVKIKSILLGIVTSLAAVLLPRASYYLENNLKNEFIDLSSKAINFIFIIAIPLTFYFILFASEGINFISGDAYRGAVLPMQIIMPTIFLIGLSNIIGIQMLVPLGREKIVLYSEIAGAIVNILMNLIFIPRYQAIGAAMATVSAELSVTIFQIYVMKDLVISMFKKVKFIKIIIGVLLSSIISIWIKMANLNSFLTLITSSFAYFGIYFLLLLFMKETMICYIKNQIMKYIIR